MKAVELNGFRLGHSKTKDLYFVAQNTPIKVVLCI
jgi:hypothetical protein